jgi:hypothetical protein
MHVDDVAAWASIAGLGLALIAFLWTVRTWVTGRQRELRKQLRDVLRVAIRAAEDLRDGRRKKAAAQSLQNCVEKLRALQEEEIISPNPRRLAELAGLYHTVSLMTDWSSGKHTFSFGNGYSRLIYQTAAFSDLYIRATTKMDNFGYITYLRYRRAPNPERPPMAFRDIPYPDRKWIE